MLVSVFAHIFIPLIALLAVAVIQFDKSTPMPAQIAEGGTDLCILAIGATGSLFISPKLHEKFGPDGAYQHHDRARHNYFGGDVSSYKSLADGAA